MNEKEFINTGIDTGIKSYINYKNGEGVKSASITEFSIVNILVQIYGEINITNPYTLGSEEAFIKNLMMYGLSKEETENFLNNIGKYYTWLHTSNPGEKTMLITLTELNIMNMVLLKKSKTELTKEETSIYDNFFSYTGGAINKVRMLLNEDLDIVPRVWSRKKTQLTNQIHLEKINPDLLSKQTYLQYGINIEELKKLSNYQIHEINQKILTEETNVGGGRTNTPKQKTLTLSSGSGFVDTIVILSIIATEIMVGLIVAFSFYGR